MFNGPAFIRAKGAAEIGDGERVLTDPRGVTQWPAAGRSPASYAEPRQEVSTGEGNGSRAGRGPPDGHHKFDPRTCDGDHRDRETEFHQRGNRPRHRHSPEHLGAFGGQAAVKRSMVGLHPGPASARPAIRRCHEGVRWVKRERSEMHQPAPQGAEGQPHCSRDRDDSAQPHRTACARVSRVSWIFGDGPMVNSRRRH